LARVRDKIKGETLKGVTEEIRQLPTKDERDGAKKRLLPSVTFAGTFSERCNAGISQRSGLIVLDIDEIEKKLGYIVNDLKQVILDTFEPAMMFRSVSKDGLKIICRIDTTAKHELYFPAFVNYFQQKFSLPLCTGGDIVRACFLCHDPEAYLSDNPTMFGLDFLKKYGVIEKNEGRAINGGDGVDGIIVDDPDEAFRIARGYADKEILFVEGSRFNYVSKIAETLNRAGIHKEIVEAKFLRFMEPGFDEKEIRGIVTGIYRRTGLFGIAPLRKRNWAKEYTGFPLPLLHVPSEQVLGQIEKILSGSYEWVWKKSDPPTSVKNTYLTDTLKGRMKPSLFLLIAAVKSIIGHRNYCDTTREYIFERMYGTEPKRAFRRVFFDNLVDKAIEKKMMVKLSDYRRYYVSIKLSVDELEKEINKYNSKKNELKQKVKNAEKRIKESRRAIPTP
jgi:hypothetical protein